MQIRQARSADAGVVNDLLKQLGYPQNSKATTAAQIEAWTSNPTSAVYVADVHGDILGVIAVHICPFFERTGSWARIVALVVLDKARQQGVGSKLIAAAESFAVQHGCIRMEVTSADRRTGAHTFYKHRGYTDQTGNSSRFLRDLASKDTQV
jgi:GNAT superfamily N-acetyltransferase